MPGHPRPRGCERTVTTGNNCILSDAFIINLLQSTEYIKFSFSKHLLEDINFLTTLSGGEIFKPKQAYMILRDMLEKVIESYVIGLYNFLEK